MRQKEKVTCILSFCFFVELSKLALPDSPFTATSGSLGQTWDAGPCVRNSPAAPPQALQVHRRNSQPQACHLGSVRQDRPVLPTFQVCFVDPAHSQQFRGRHRETSLAAQGWRNPSCLGIKSLFHLRLLWAGTLEKTRSQWTGQLLWA